MDHSKPVLFLAARANHSIKNGHVKVCIYVPHEYPELIESLTTHTLRDASRESSPFLDIREKKIRLRSLEKGVLLDINIQAATYLKGILSIFYPHIPVDISTDDGKSLMRSFAALPAEPHEITEILKLLYGKPYDYHLISTASRGNNCVTLPNKAFNTASIGLYAALGLEDHQGIQRPQHVADAITRKVQQAPDTHKHTLSVDDENNLITLASYTQMQHLDRDLWVGHTQGHQHLPMHKAVGLLEKEGILATIGQSHTHQPMLQSA